MEDYPDLVTEGNLTDGFINQHGGNGLFCLSFSRWRLFKIYTRFEFRNKFHTVWLFWPIMAHHLYFTSSFRRVKFSCFKISRIIRKIQNQRQSMKTVRINTFMLDLENTKTWRPVGEVPLRENRKKETGFFSAPVYFDRHLIERASSPQR